MRTPRFFRAWRYIPEMEDVPKIWDMAGLGMTEYRKLPWSEKFELFKKHKPQWVVAWWKAPFLKAWQSFRVWKDRPAGGYLFAAWCRHNAEDQTIINNYPHANLSCGHRPRPIPERPL